MRKRFKKSEYFLAGVLALVAAFPLAVGPTFVGSVDASVISTKTIQEQALNNYSTYRDSRRAYQQAQQLCIQLRASGKQVTCPDINDAAGIQYFLSTHNNLPTATGSNVKIVQSSADLTPYQQSLLQWYVKINTCPDTMKSYLPGFFDLCQSLLNKRPMTGLGLVGPQGTQSSSVSTLDDMIKANKGVKKTW